MKFGLKEAVVEQIIAVLRQYSSIEKVVIYGSRAKGTYKEGSDIDLCLYGKGVSRQMVLEIENVLDDLLLPYTFDLASYHLLTNSELISHIDRIGLPFYQKIANTNRKRGQA